MQALFRDLRDLGYHQLALPVVAMQQLIADLVIDNSQLRKLVHLRYPVSPHIALNVANSDLRNVLI